MTTTSNKIREITAAVLGIPAAGVMAASTFEELNADSFDIMAIIMEAERECGLGDGAIRDELSDAIKTVGELIRHVEELKGER